MSKNYYSRDLPWTLQNIENRIKENKFFPEDRDLLLQWIYEKQAASSIRETTLMNVLGAITSIEKLLEVPLKRAEIQDIYKVIIALKSGNYTTNTTRTYIRALKSILSWMIENGHNTNITEKKLRGIQVPTADTKVTAPDDLLTEEDILRLINACQSSRDRAIIAILYDAALRIKEVTTLTWGDLVWDRGTVGLKIQDAKQSSLERYTRLTFATPYLAAWRQDYPGNSEDTGAPVFINRFKTSLTYISTRFQIIEIARRAGLEKRVNTHLFRKSRITDMVRKGTNESIIKMVAWGNVNSKMFQTYCVLGKGDIDSALEDIAGLIPRDKKKQIDILKPIDCKRCHTINPPGGRYCSHCGDSLSEDAASELIDLERLVENTPEYKDLVESIARELKIRGSG